MCPSLSHVDETVCSPSPTHPFTIVSLSHSFIIFFPSVFVAQLRRSLPTISSYHHRRLRRSGLAEGRPAISHRDGVA